MNPMTRRRLLAGAAATATAAIIPNPAAAASRRITVAATGTRWDALTRDHHTSGPFPPGAADGPVSFHRTGSEIAVYQMHGNGHTYRHQGATLATVRPGVWVYGRTDDNGDRGRYAGISSVLAAGSTLHGWVHQEAYTDVATIGQVRSSDGGYTWTDQGTIIRGVDLQPDGFRGAELPSVVRTPSEYVMLYGNRYGNGRHQQIWRATAPVRRDGSPGRWTVRGETITETGEPHFHAASPCVRWSTVWRKWLCVYSTDTAYRYRTSTNLRSWSAPTTIVTKAQQWTQTSGYYRWYPTLLDERSDSTTVGSSAILFEHQLNVTDPLDRYPATYPVTIR